MNISIKAVMAFIAVAFTINVTKGQTVTDKTVKKSISPVSNAINYITQLQPLSFEFDNSKNEQPDSQSGRYFGFIADDVKQVLPEVVSSSSKWVMAGKNNPRAVTTNTVKLQELVPLLVGAIKDQQSQIEQLQQEVQALKAKVK